MNTGQNLPQSALARTILPHERVTRSRHHVKTYVLECHRSRKSFADAAKTDGGNGNFGAQENEINRLIYGLGGGGSIFGCAADSNESIGTAMRLPVEKDSIAAKASCKARRPARACTGGCVPALNASITASMCRSNVR